MKVTGIKLTHVTVPMEAPLRWSMGVETGTTRAIIEVITDEGITGIGETYGGKVMEHAIEVAKPYILGLDPLEVGILNHRLGVFCIGYETAVPAIARAGIEMAFLDAAGKALNRPIHSILGGRRAQPGRDCCLLVLSVPGREGDRRRDRPPRLWSIERKN